MPGMSSHELLLQVGRSMAVQVEAYEMSVTVRKLYVNYN